MAVTFTINARVVYFVHNAYRSRCFTTCWFAFSSEGIGMKGLLLLIWCMEMAVCEQSLNLERSGLVCCGTCFLREVSCASIGRAVQFIKGF